MSAVFVSYSHSDRDRVLDLIEGLKRSQVAVWWDDDIPRGSNWDDQVEAALENASTVIIVWSQDAISSENVKDEAYYAREEHKALPVRIEDVIPPFRFRRLQSVDLFRRPMEANEDWDDLIAAVSERLGRKPDLTATTPGAGVRRRGGVALQWHMVLPALLVGLSLATSVGAAAYENVEARRVSWALGGAALAFAVTNVVRPSWRD